LCKIKEFNKSRLSFAVIDENTLAVNDADERDSRTFLKEDYNINDQTFETLIRGYIKRNYVVFYKTNKFSECGYIPQYVLRLITKAAVNKYGRGIRYKTYDGLKPGTFGEDWEPRASWGLIET
jgi:hypothetical protein